MTLQQLASDYKQLMAVTNSLASCLEHIEILDKYPEGKERRQWSSHNCWIYKGDAIANVNLAQMDISLEKYKQLMHNINSSQELKMLLQGIEIDKINEQK